MLSGSKAAFTIDSVFSGGLARVRGFGIVLLVVGVFAAAATVESEVIDVAPIVEQIVATPELAETVEGYIESFVLKRGINPNKINAINKIDFNTLPKEVSIENIDDTNFKSLGIVIVQ